MSESGVEKEEPRAPPRNSVCHENNTSKLSPRPLAVVPMQLHAAPCARQVLMQSAVQPAITMLTQPLACKGVVASSIPTPCASPAILAPAPPRSRPRSSSPLPVSRQNTAVRCSSSRSRSFSPLVLARPAQSSWPRALSTTSIRACSSTSSVFPAPPRHKYLATSPMLAAPRRPIGSTAHKSTVPIDLGGVVPTPIPMVSSRGSSTAVPQVDTKPADEHVARHSTSLQSSSIALRAPSILGIDQLIEKSEPIEIPSRAAAMPRDEDDQKQNDAAVTQAPTPSVKAVAPMTGMMMGVPRALPLKQAPPIVVAPPQLAPRSAANVYTVAPPSQCFSPISPLSAPRRILTHGEPFACVAGSSHHTRSWVALPQMRSRSTSPIFCRPSQFGNAAQPTSAVLNTVSSTAPRLRYAGPAPPRRSAVRGCDSHGAMSGVATSSEPLSRSASNADLGCDAPTLPSSANPLDIENEILQPAPSTVQQDLFHLKQEPTEQRAKLNMNTGGAAYLNNALDSRPEDAASHLGTEKIADVGASVERAVTERTPQKMNSFLRMASREHSPPSTLEPTTPLLGRPPQSIAHDGGAAIGFDEPLPIPPQRHPYAAGNTAGDAEAGDECVSSWGDTAVSQSEKTRPEVVLAAIVAASAERRASCVADRHFLIAGCSTAAPSSGRHESTASEGDAVVSDERATLLQFRDEANERIRIPAGAGCTPQRSNKADMPLQTDSAFYSRCGESRWRGLASGNNYTSHGFRGADDHLHVETMANPFENLTSDPTHALYGVGGKERRLREIFDAMDLDGSGEVNKREFIKTLKKSSSVANFFGLSRNVRQEDGSRVAFERMFQALDRNSDRVITWEEFKAFYSSIVGSSG